MLDMLKIQAEVQQAGKEVRRGDTNSDIFNLEVIVATVKMG